MSLFDAAILGIVEGLSEFLPISSTGHLILASYLLNIPQTAFVKSFEIAIQLGAILAVVVLYWRAFLDVEMLKRIAAAFVPTGLIGVALYPFIKAELLGSEVVVLAALFMGGVALILFEYVHSEEFDATGDIAHMSYLQAVGVGLFQSLAIIPGVSRSAATILGGLVLGLRRAAIVEFSFLLAVPTMGAATALDLYHNYQSFSAADIGALALGFVTAFLVALFVIKWFLAYVRTRTFVPFGVYRILIALIFLALFIAR
jgi:undecaprenyl-diphosphatase